MRNLHIRVHQTVATGLEGGEPTEIWCKDPDSREVFTVDSEGKIWKLGRDDDDQPSILVDLKAEGLLQEDAKCLNLCPLPELQAVLVALSSGELIQVGVTGPGDLEEVGAVSAGLLALDLSPDSEIITLVTADLNLIFMTRDYTPLSETQIHQAEFGEGKFVNVGWGAKETQFHGSEGKAARVVNTESGEVTEEDDQRVRLSWRGDGEMLAVSYVTPAEAGSDGARSRKIRVFDRQGALFSTSENCVGLEHNLCWKPSGNLIATTIRKPNKHVVGFFEKNGLQHGEFSLRTPGKILAVTWNCDSSILAVWIQTSAENSQNLIQFWTIGNYHWYLKQEMCVNSGTLNPTIIAPKWDTEDPNLFHFFSSSSTHSKQTSFFNTVTLARETDTSCGKLEDDLALVAVIDGQTVKVTPMREAVIPPPMSAYEIHVGSPVTAVMFQHCSSADGQLSGTFSSNNLAVVTKDKIYFFSITDGDKGTKNLGDDAVKITGAGGNGYIVQTSRHTLHKTIEGKILDEAGLCNFTWIDDTILASTDIPNSALVVMQVCDEKLIEKARLSCEGSVYSISPGNHGAAFIQLNNATVLEYKDDCLEPMLEWPRVCSSVLSTTYGVLGLSSSGKLYLNENEIATNITSIFLHSHFLLATTMDHRLVALPVQDLDMSAGGGVKWQDASDRRVERGSRLVTAVAHGSRTILQMPRGNLETIQPRSLTIHLLKDLLNALKYKDSFLLARRQRLNLNLLVDHDPKLFIDNIGQFVSQVNSEADHLNIFLAELKDESVCTTMYAAQYKHQQKQEWPEKVKKVCEAVRKVLEDSQAASSGSGQANLVSILGTLVRQGNMLEEALHRIQKLRDMGEENLCDQGLRYILYSVDVNLLFNIALGTYDFHLVLMVAEKSQKDPKEYLPILNKYKSMPPDYMKYSIDKDLKRYESALKNLARCPDNFVECLQLIQDHRLFKQGMTVFPKGSDNYKSVCKIYGDYMNGKRYYLEASYLYEQAGDYENAVRTSESACSWERAGDLARRAGWSAEQLNHLFTGLAAKLEESDRGMESAVIWREWLQDTEECIAVLARTKCWHECIRQIRQVNRVDLLETHLLPGLQDRKQVLLASILSSENKIKDQVVRLELIRATRSAKVDDDDVEQDDRNLEDADLFSETTSVGGSVAASSAKSKSTLATRTSNRSKSSKGRRKQERKLYSTKEGSAHEDLGLIAELHETMVTVPSLIAEIATITRAFLDLGQLEDPGVEAGGSLTDLQNQAQKLLDLCEEMKPRIWLGQETVKERFGPQATVHDIVRAAGGENLDGSSLYRSPLELMESHLRFPPRFNIDMHWKLQIL